MTRLGKFKKVNTHATTLFENQGWSQNNSQEKGNNRSNPNIRLRKHKGEYG